MTHFNDHFTTLLLIFVKFISLHFSNFFTNYLDFSSVGLSIVMEGKINFHNLWLACDSPSHLHKKFIFIYLWCEYVWKVIFLSGEKVLKLMSLFFLYHELPLSHKDYYIITIPCQIATYFFFYLSQPSFIFSLTFKRPSAFTWPS